MAGRGGRQRLPGALEPVHRPYKLIVDAAAQTVQERDGRLVPARVSLGRDYVVIDRLTPYMERVERVVSFLLPRRGCAVSLLFRPEPGPFYWYIDVVQCTRRGLRYHVTDLYADVIGLPAGGYKVVDLDELAAALAAGFLSLRQGTFALKSLDGVCEGLNQHGLAVVPWLVALGIDPGRHCAGHPVFGGDGLPMPAGVP